MVPGQSLRQLRFGIARFILGAEERSCLPGFLGSTLRGALGSALRSIACLPLCRQPATCMLRDRCAYAYCFETSSPKGSQHLRKLAHIPHPFLIETSF